MPGRKALGVLTAVATALPRAVMAQGTMAPQALSIETVSQLNHLGGAVAISRDGTRLVASICRATDRQSRKGAFGREAPSWAFGCQLVLRNVTAGREDTLTTR